jgi:hypothetical protein
MKAGILGWRIEQHILHPQPLPFLTDANSAEAGVMNGWYFELENRSTHLTAYSNSHRR